MSLISKCCSGKVYSPTKEWARCLSCMEMCDTVNECPYGECDGEGYVTCEYLNEKGDNYNEVITKCVCKQSFAEYEDWELACQG